ncbi:hypothetical protein WR25_06854 [Diploscapter pachys]|uniref:Lipase domain-containing protein n=1 Tax=Diploscapter pachys TaxID=2018661 RepID=A0A2A2L5H2_9BILA|nr:hypothetical protein WR25_06854 [Diploscapter pachys]
MALTIRLSLFLLSSASFVCVSISQKVGGPKGPLTSHFIDWLAAHGYEQDQFERPEIGPNGSFGGKRRHGEQITNEPVIFIHGNGDTALYTQAPLATGWSRKVLKGGELIGTDGNCSLGPPLTKHIDTFLGISGPNYGLCVCQLAQTVPAWCNALDGLYPGYTCQDQMLCGYTAGNCKQENYSALLEKLNNDSAREAEHVYAMWSDVDEVLLFRGLTWGKPTSRIPGMNGRWISDRNSHIAMKDLTELRQYEAVVHHSI